MKHHQIECVGKFIIERRSLSNINDLPASNGRIVLNVYDGVSSLYCSIGTTWKELFRQDGLFTLQTVEDIPENPQESQMIFYDDKIYLYTNSQWVVVWSEALNVKTSNVNQSVDGIKTFLKHPEVHAEAGNPTEARQVVTKDYLEGYFSDLTLENVRSNSPYVQGNIYLAPLAESNPANFNLIKKVKDPVDSQDVATKHYCEEVLTLEDLRSTDNNLSGDLNMAPSGVTAPSNFHKVTSLKTPASDYDAANKKYVDDSVGSKSDVGHSHAQADVTDLVGDLAGKSDVGHGHAQADVTDLVGDLDGKSDVGHGHSIEDVTSLQDELDKKAEIIYGSFIPSSMLGGSLNLVAGDTTKFKIQTVSSGDYNFCLYFYESGNYMVNVFSSVNESGQVGFPAVRLNTGINTITATVTSGSAILTNVNTGLEPWAAVVSEGLPLSAPGLGTAEIVSHNEGAKTITVNITATATTVGATCIIGSASTGFFYNVDSSVNGNIRVTGESGNKQTRPWGFFAIKM